MSLRVLFFADCIGAMICTRVIYVGHCTILVGKKISQIVTFEHTLDH